MLRYCARAEEQRWRQRKVRLQNTLRSAPATAQRWSCARGEHAAGGTRGGGGQRREGAANLSCGALPCRLATVQTGRWHTQPSLPLLRNTAHAALGALLPPARRAAPALLRSSLRKRVAQQQARSMDAAAAHEAAEAPEVPACVSETRALLEEAHSSGAVSERNAAESACVRCRLLPEPRSSAAARLPAATCTLACSGADAPRRRRRDTLRERRRRRRRAGGAPRGRRCASGRRRGGAAAPSRRRGSRVAAVRRCVASHSARDVP
jgi:hypothetical protein